MHKVISRFGLLSSAGAGLSRGKECSRREVPKFSSRSNPYRRGVLITALLAVLIPAGDAAAGFCWGYTGFSATNPQSWVTTCNDGADSPALPTTSQIIGHEHRNWHCTNPVDNTEAYGRAFLAFHRQFILDFNNWRLANTNLGRLEIWDPFQNAPVPGDDETTSTAFTHCSTPSNVRPAGAICTGCQNLPATYIGSNLNGFSSLGEVGMNLETGPNAWHTSYHNGVTVLGCADIGGFRNTSRDPAFWMAHNKLDEVARDWQTLQATDVVIVIDRSGSMDDNCSSTTPPPTESPCAINAAKQAARTFADALVDVRMDGAVPAAEQHRIGLASFSSSASTHLILTPAAGIVTGDSVNNTPFENALAGISTGGATSIAAGIREATAILNAVPDPNPHQAILVLTDGKENTAPCLGGNSPSSCISSDVLTASEIGDIQIVAIGYGPGAEEPNLRDVAERHGGIFVAEANVDDELSLQKFFITASGEIFDSAVSADPKGTMQSGQQMSKPFKIPICGDQRLSVVLGYQEVARGKCELGLELFTPKGQRVKQSDPGVEAGHGPRHDFMHVNLPYLEESRGTWTGRVVRSPHSSLSCKPQNYFYSVLLKGDVGRINPLVVRPNLVVGRRILATFRITESNRPIGGFDGVKAWVTLTRPNGETTKQQLYDDGTHGDRLAGNNIWSVEIPGPANEVGVYHLRGHFELTKSSCTQVRESEYSIVGQPTPKQCTKIACGGTIRVQPGQKLLLDDPVCLWNMCASTTRYDLHISDSRGWIKTPHRKTRSRLIKAPQSFKSGKVKPFGGQCFGRGPTKGHPAGGIPLYAIIPKSARPGDTSVISVRVASLKNPDQKPVACKTRIVVAAPPDCNRNRVDDAVDIAKGTSKDKNRDGTPDECQRLPHYHPPKYKSAK